MTKVFLTEIEENIHYRTYLKEILQFNIDYRKQKELLSQGELLEALSLALKALIKLE